MKRCEKMQEPERMGDTRKEGISKHIKTDPLMNSQKLWPMHGVCVLLAQMVSQHQEGKWTLASISEPEVISN